MSFSSLKVTHKLYIGMFPLVKIKGVRFIYSIKELKYVYKF